MPLTPDPAVAAEQLQGAGLTFLHAPHYYPSLGRLEGLRRQLRTRPLLNLLGPLLNPSDPDYQLIGVSEERFCRPVAEALHALGRAGVVVHGNGLDEVAIDGPTRVLWVTPEGVQEARLSPECFGIMGTTSERQLPGGTPQQNAKRLQTIFEGKGAPRDCELIAVNAALFLKVSGSSDSLPTLTQRVMTLLAGPRLAHRLAQLRMGGRCAR